MTAADRRVFWGAVLFALAAAAYAVSRIHALGWHVDLGSVPFDRLGWLGYLAVPLAFTAGQLWRVYTHARGIRKGGTAHVLGRDHR